MPPGKRIVTPPLIRAGLATTSLGTSGTSFKALSAGESSALQSPSRVRHQLSRFLPKPTFFENALTESPLALHSLNIFFASSTLQYVSGCLLISLACHARAHHSPLNRVLSGGRTQGETPSREAWSLRDWSAVQRGPRERQHERESATTASLKADVGALSHSPDERITIREASCME